MSIWACPRHWLLGGANEDIRASISVFLGIKMLYKSLYVHCHCYLNESSGPGRRKPAQSILHRGEKRAFAVEGSTNKQ